MHKGAPLAFMHISLYSALYSIYYTLWGKWLPCGENL